MESTVAERIKILVDKYADKPADFARATGLTSQNVYDLTSGRKGDPSLASFKKILIALPDVSERWLMLGEGNMLKNKELVRDSSAPYTRAVITNSSKIPNASELANLETTLLPDFRAFFDTITNQSIHERLRVVIEQLAGGIQARFAERVGVPTGTIGDILGKKKSKPGFELTGKILHAYPEVSERWFITGEGEMLKPDVSTRHQEISSYPTGQGNAHAVGLLSDIPVIELRRVSFKARASFNYAQLQRFKESDIFDTVLFRLPPGRTEEDYKDALVFDIEGDSMEPSLRDGQQVIAWPVSEGKWEYLHNTICVVDYDETVTVKAVLKNDLNNTDGLTLHATGGLGGSFTVARKDIHSIWEVREFYGVVPVRLLP